MSKPNMSVAIDLMTATYFEKRFDFTAKKDGKVLKLSQPQENVGNKELNEEYWHYRWKDENGKNVIVQTALMYGLIDMILKGYYIEATLKEGN